MITICTKCNIELTSDNWYKSNRKKCYYICNDCVRKVTSKWKKNNPDKIKESRKEYYWKHRKQELIYSKKWAKENPNKAYEKTKRYNQTEHGKEKIRVYQAKRNRELGYVLLLNNPFPDEVDIDYHHINDLIVLPIPRIIHRKNSHPSRDKHRLKCKGFIEDFYGLGCLE